MTGGGGGGREYFEEIKRALDGALPQAEVFIGELYRAYLDERQIFMIGNGGSAANASHFSQDLNKGTVAGLSASKCFRAVSLTDNAPFLTALANDEGYDSVFAGQLKALGRPGDLLVAISVSGNSPNVLRAAEHAGGHGMRVIGITGRSGGRLAELAQESLRVPSDDAGVVETVHSAVFHLAVARLRGRIAGQRQGGA